MDKGTGHPADIPSLRKRIWSAYRLIRALLFVMLRRRTGILLRGNVYELRTRCGKPSCVCNRGELHRRWVLSESAGGKKRLRVVPEKETERWRRWAENYRQFRRGRAEFVKLTRRILADLDALEKAQRRSPEG